MRNTYKLLIFLIIVISSCRQKSNFYHTPLDLPIYYFIRTSPSSEYLLKNCMKKIEKEEVIKIMTNKKICVSYTIDVIKDSLISVNIQADSMSKETKLFIENYMLHKIKGVSWGDDTLKYYQPKRNIMSCVRKENFLPFKYKIARKLYNTNKRSKDFKK